MNEHVKGLIIFCKEMFEYFKDFFEHFVKENLRVCSIFKILREEKFARF